MGPEAAKRFAGHRVLHTAPSAEDAVPRRPAGRARQEID
jgi:hypothetical protein